jgi:hypothetical protein
MGKKDKKKKGEIEVVESRIEENKDTPIGSLLPKAIMIALKELLPRIDCSFIKPKDFYIDKDGDTHIEFVVGDEYEVYITMGSIQDVDSMTKGEKYAIRINNLQTDAYRKITYECYEEIE